MDEGMTAVAEGSGVVPATQEQTPEIAVKDEPIDLDAQPEEPAGEPGASEQEGETPPTDEGEGGETPTEEPEFAEIEIDGKTYQVPNELKDGYLRYADYTRKTMAVAEEGKQVAALKAEAEAAFNVSQEVIEARARMIGLEEKLKHFEATDWQKYVSEDPMGAQADWIAFQQLQQQHGQVSQYLNTQQAQRSEQMERETANRLRETAEFAKTKIPGWTPEMDAKIVGFVESLGIPRDQIVQAVNPQVYQLMHLAYLGSQSLAKQQTPPKPVAPTQPLKTVSAKASPQVTKDPENMSMEEYAAFRKTRNY